jgi:hypothetical protein
VETSPAFHSHPSETVWEEYSFGRLSNQEVAALEEHLLVCETCRTSLEELTEYIRLMKAGTATLATTPPERLARSWRQFRRSASQPLNRVVWITGLAAIGVAAWLPHVPVPSAAPSVVNLASFRGVDAAVARAPARKPLNLYIDAGDVPAAPEYRMVVVTASGEQVWAGRPKVSGGMLSVMLPRGLKSGPYWVRLYSPESKILAEYSLRLE